MLMPETLRIQSNNSDRTMHNKMKTHLICYDDFRWFSEEVRRKFDDTSRYNIVSFVTVEEYMLYLEKNKANKYSNIAILGAHDTTEQFEMIGRLVGEIKKIDSRNGIILLCTPDKMDEIKRIISSDIDAYISKNTNAMVRLHNAVKKFQSEHAINNFRKRRNFSFYLLAGFIIIYILLIVLAFFKFPIHF